MSKDNNNNTTTTATSTVNPHKLGIIGKIADGFRRLSHDHSSHQTHQYGTTDSAHDNAFVGESGIVGAHAIPPQLGAETNHSQAKGSSIGHDNHRYGGPENKHDNAYVSEAVMTGTHAIPPMTFHARHDLNGNLKQENQKMK
ncbi:hypothetical protein BGZ93_007593 [Podila epicladia]|nr:hypothetical protein BGZ92_007444 [Podila epicladia]KAG0093995.1 hypothetical protein BGZ93_007593 [Podila epicladia]